MKTGAGGAKGRLLISWLEDQPSGSPMMAYCSDSQHTLECCEILLRVCNLSTVKTPTCDSQDESKYFK